MLERSSLLIILKTVKTFFKALCQQTYRQTELRLKRQQKHIMKCIWKALNAQELKIYRTRGIFSYERRPLNSYSNTKVALFLIFETKSHYIDLQKVVLF